MKNALGHLGLSAMLCCISTAWGQQTQPADAPAGAAAAKPARSTAQSEAGEPRANTSDPRPEPEEVQPAARPAPARPPGNVPAAGQKAAATKPATAADRLQLGTATVTGDREQPKVMYVVPWKRPDIGDAEGKPMNSLVDEILSPVDRDVFKREVSYYQTIKSEAAQNGAPAAAQQVEK